jgi:hypothetical protein
MFLISSVNYRKILLLLKPLKSLSGEGIPFTGGNIRKRKRRIISKVFHYDFLNDMIPFIH